MTERPENEKRSPVMPHDEVIQRCRRERREMLQQWDAATEKTIDDYESSVVEIRISTKRELVESRRLLSHELKRLQESADVQRMQVQEQHGNVTAQPKISAKRDQQEIQAAHQLVQASLADANAWLQNQAIVVDEPTDNANACAELGETSPESIEAAIQTLKRLAKHGQQLNDQIPRGITSTLVAGYVLPIVGGLVGLAIAAVLWLGVSEPSPFLAMIAVVCAVGLGLAGHLALAKPLKGKADQLAPVIARIADAAQHCVVKAKQISHTIRHAETAQLEGVRDSELSRVDQWLVDQERELKTKHNAADERSEDHMLEQLQDLDLKFPVVMAKVESEMRTKADQLAQQINDALEPKG